MAIVLLGGLLVSFARPSVAATPGVSATGPTMAIGDHHSVVIRTDGTVWTWGLNRSGQLGVPTNYGTDIIATSPAPVPGLTTAVAVAAGADFTVVLLADGTVRTFGANQAGQLGTTPAGPEQSRSIPQQPSALTGVVAIAAGQAFTVAVTDDGAVWGFGSNSRGQLGEPLPVKSDDPNPAPRPIFGLDQIVRVAAGTEHVVALTNRGVVWTLGLNTDGQLGRTTSYLAYAPNPVPAPVREAGKVVAVAASGQHSAVLNIDGAAWTFGRNSYGELGTAVDLFWRRASPQRVAALGHGVALATGPTSTVVADGDGVVRGVGGRVLRYTTEPLIFPALGGIAAVTAGPSSTLVLGADGSLAQVPFPSVVPPSVPQGLLNDVLLPAPPLQFQVDLDYQGFSPIRLLETRLGAVPTIDGRFSNIGPLVAHSVTELAITARAGIPDGSRAVVLNVTVTGAQSSGYITVFPCDSGRPNASNLNFLVGDTVPNAVVAKLSAAGTICVFTSASTDLIVDASGVYPTGSMYIPLTPARLLETRSGATPTIDRRFSNEGSLAADSTTELVIAGRGEVPVDAAAAVFNVTVIDAAAGGYTTVFPCDAGRPNASHLNFAARQTIANTVIVKLSAVGSVCVYTSAATHMLIDANGASPAGSSYVPLAPRRVFETRGGATPTIDGRFSNGGALAAGTTTELQLTGRADVPTGAAAVVLNVTVVGAKDAGYVTVYPCDSARPNASNLNFVSGQTIPNAVIVRPSVTGAVCLFTTAPVDMLVDVNGYQPG